MKAERMTIEAIDRIPEHRGDNISREERREVWEALERDYRKNKGHANLPGHSITLISGPRESGKTNLAMLLTALYGHGQGYECFFNMSSLFGHRLDGLDMALFNKAGPDYSFLVADEVHLVLPRIRSGALYNTTIIGSFAAARKKQMNFIGLTSQESMLDPYFKVEVEWALYPVKRRPKPNERNPKTGRFYPGWAYLNVRKIGPRPFRTGRTLADEYERDMPVGSPKVYGREPRMIEFPLQPALVYRAACLSSSFEQLPSEAASGMNVMAKHIRQGLDSYERDGEGEDPNVLYIGGEGADETAAQEEALAAAERQRRMEVAQTYLAAARNVIEDAEPGQKRIDVRWLNHRVEALMQKRGQVFPGDKESKGILGAWVGYNANSFNLKEFWKLWPDTRDNPPVFGAV